MEKNEGNKKQSSSETSIEEFYDEQSALLSLAPTSNDITTALFLHAAALQHIYLDIPTPPPNQLIV